MAESKSLVVVEIAAVVLTSLGIALFIHTEMQDQRADAVAAARERQLDCRHLFTFAKDHVDTLYIVTNVPKCMEQFR